MKNKEHNLSTDKKESLEDNSHIAAEVRVKPAEDWIPETYLPFAFYTLLDRALLLEDGLKPVNRRILWAMYSKGITPKHQHLKAARAAAETVAYHPHGPAAIEKALARMAQTFVQRVPLIDPFGSVGKVFGDEPAAARYWECRLTPAAMEILKDIDEGGIEFSKNFDETLDEPKRLPTRWPVGVINGTQGIAVAYAAKIPPHNPDEIMQAAIELVDNPDMTTDELMKFIKGPDFPTGGEIFGIDKIKDYLETGVGTFTVRGRYNVESLPRGRSRITFYELPYEVSAESVIKTIKKVQQDGKSKGKLYDISTMKDLTGKGRGLSLVFETKPGANVQAVLASLFKETAIESKFAVNSTVVVNGTPVVQGMVQQLQQFINFRKVIVRNKATFRLDKIKSRIAQIEALLAALMDIDKAISIIRESKDSAAAQNALVKEFKINKQQAEYILSMQLRRLTKADSQALSDEKDKLLEEEQSCKAILNKDEEALKARVKLELKETRKVISSERISVISGLSDKQIKEQEKQFAQTVKAAEKDTPCYITRLTNGKFVMSLDRDVYSIEDKVLKHGPIVETVKTSTQSEVAVVFENGLAKRVPANFFPEGKSVGAKELGINSDSRIVGIAKTDVNKFDIGLAVVTAKGEMKIAKPDFAKTEEFTVAGLAKGDLIVNTLWLSRSVKGKKFVLVSSYSNAIAFDAESIRVSGSKAGTVKAMKLKSDDDRVIAFGLVDSPKETVIVSEGSRTLKVTPVTEIPVKGKGGMGVALHRTKANEKDTLKSAFVGSNAVVTMGNTGNVLTLPAISKRALTGTELDIKVDYGAIVSANN